MATAPVPGTPFGLALVAVPPVTSGPAAASLVTGIGSILVSFVVGCLAVAGANGGWGPLVAGAFTALGAFLGVAALVLGRIGLRQTRRVVGAGRTDYVGAARTDYVGAARTDGTARSSLGHLGTVRGRGLAVAGFSCGAVGLAFTIGAFVTAFALAAGG
ncbi:MAG TPA: hypothetical protein VF163_12255 [Micromonosporaceae bacterium]